MEIVEKFANMAATLSQDAFEMVRSHVIRCADVSIPIMKSLLNRRNTCELPKVVEQSVV